MRHYVDGSGSVTEFKFLDESQVFDAVCTVVARKPIYLTSMLEILSYDHCRFLTQAYNTYNKNTYSKSLLIRNMKRTNQCTPLRRKLTSYMGHTKNLIHPNTP